MLLSLTAFPQLKKYQREVDSLSKVYNKNVIGYSRTITVNGEPRESFLVFYVENGETEEFIAWTKIIDSDVKILVLNGFELDDSVVIPKQPDFSINIPIYYDNNLIGSMEYGYFTKIPRIDYEKYAVIKSAQLLLEDDEKLDKWLRIKFGGYYKSLK